MRILYLVRRNAGADRIEFRNSVLAFAGSELTPIADSVTVAVSDLEPPRVNVIPFRRDLVALVSLDGVGEETLWPDPTEGFAGAFTADTAWPVVHEQDWETGERSPGAGLLTLFRRKKGITEEAFLKRWFEGHTPLTLEVHPNVGYVRNRVTASWPAAGSPAGSDAERQARWDGIVEEQYDPAGDLLKARRFFGGSLAGMLPTMLRVYRDVRGFIDYGSIETWLTSEYRLRTDDGSDRAESGPA